MPPLSVVLLELTAFGVDDRAPEKLHFCPARAKELSCLQKSPDFINTVALLGFFLVPQHLSPV